MKIFIFTSCGLAKPRWIGVTTHLNRSSGEGGCIPFECLAARITVQSKTTVPIESEIPYKFFKRNVT